MENLACKRITKCAELIRHFNMKKIFCFIVACCCCFLQSRAQKESSIWYFGNKAGIDFNSGTATAIGTSAMNSSEPCATICDEFGNLLFYTSGSSGSIWDKTHSPMPNGAVLTGDNSASQGVLITPVIGDNSKYYVFTGVAQEQISQMVGHPMIAGLRYFIVDLTLPGNGTPACPLGDVVVPVNSHLTAAPLRDSIMEEIISVMHTNGTDYWIIVRDYNSNIFYSFLVTATGVNTTPIISVTGINAAANGQFKVSKDGKQLLKTHYGSINSTELIDFNSTSGVLSNATVIATSNYLSWGAAFSCNDSVIYVTTRVPVAGWTLLQYQRYAPIVSATETVIATSNLGQYGALELGMDGKIYVIHKNQANLSTINTPNNTLAPNYAPLSFTLAAGSFSGLGLPSIFHGYVKNFCNASSGTGIGIQHAFTVCAGDSVDIGSMMFEGNNTYRWSPTSGMASTSSSLTKVSPTATTTYTLSITSLNCTVTTDTVRINFIPTSISTVTLSTACDSIFYGSTWYYNTQTITDTIFSGSTNGCDSIINTHIHINNSASASITTTSCGNYTSPGGNIITTSGMYFDTIPSSTGCDSLITINLTVIDSVVSFFNVTTCDSLMINGNWYFNSQLVRDTIFGASANGCDSIVKTNLTILNSSITTNTFVACPGQQTTIHGINQMVSGVYTQTFNSVGGCDSISSITLIINPTAINNITLSGCDSLFTNGAWYFFSQNISDTLFARSVSGCDSIINTNISINTTPLLNFSLAADTIYFGNTVTLIASGANSYLWPDGSVGSEMTVTPMQDMIYCVVGNNGSCFDTICHQLYVVDCDPTKLYIPTAFSPNGDGINDNLCLYGAQCLKSFRFIIRDRWGEKVFESSDIEYCWDGKYKGKEMDSDVFFYYLDATIDKKNTISRKGNITLVK